MKLHKYNKTVSVNNVNEVSRRDHKNGKGYGPRNDFLLGGAVGGGGGGKGANNS